MFSEPTVFVVGAGASAEYGIAVGDALKFKIADLLDFYFEGYDLTRGVGIITLNTSSAARSHIPREARRCR